MHVFDQDGNSYIDLEAGGTRPVHVGYGRTELAQAGYDQMCQMAYFTPMGFANEPAMNLADKAGRDYATANRSVYFRM